MSLKWSCLLVVLLLIMSVALPLASSGYDHEGEEDRSGYRQPEGSKAESSDIESSEDHSLRSQEYDVELEVLTSRQMPGNPGSRVSHSFRVRNTGTAEDSYEWEAESGRGWLSDGDDEGTIEGLEANETWDFMVTIEVPGDADPNAADELTVTITSQSDPSVYDEQTTYTYISADWGCKIEPMKEQFEKYPGDDDFTITFEIKNIGNVIDRYDLEPFVMPEEREEYWEVSSRKEKTGWLSPGEEERVNLEVSVPELTMDYKVREKGLRFGVPTYIGLDARASDGTRNTTRSEVKMGRYFSADMRPVDTHRIDYSRSETRIEAEVEVMNLCNIGDTEDSMIDIVLSEKNKSFETDVETRNESHEAERWDTSPSVEPVTLSGGETREVMTLITAPREPINGTFVATYEVELDPHSDQEGLTETRMGELEVIVNQAGDVEVSPVEEELVGRPFEKALLNFSVENTGNGIDDYQLSSSTENAWETTLIDFDDGAIINDIHPEEEVYVEVEVMVPDQTPVGHEEEAELTATSLFEQEVQNETVSDSAHVTIRIEEGYSVILEPDMNQTMASPQETVSYQIDVTNAGNVRDTILLSLDHPPTGAWDAELESTSLDIERWNTSSTTLHVTPYSDAVHEEPFEVTVIGRSSSDTSKSDNATTLTQVVQVPEVDLNLDATDLSIKPGETLDLRVSIRNEGNAFDTLNLSAEANHTDWLVDIEEDLHVLEAREGSQTNVSITAPEIPRHNASYENLDALGILAGEYVELILTGMSTSDTSVFETIEREIEVEEVHRHNLTSFERKDVLPGGSVTHRIRVDNRGNSEDTVYLTVGEDEDNPYLEHVSFDDTSVHLEIGDSKEVNVTLEVPVHLRPYWHQEIEVPIGTEDRSASVEIRTRVVLLDCEEPYQRIRVGRSASYDLTLVNVPTEEEVVERGIDVGDSLQDTFYLTGSFGVGGEEWEASFSRDSVGFAQAYEEDQISVEVDSPGGGAEKVEFEVTAESSQREDLADSVTTETEMFWFDLRPIDISIEPAAGSREIDITFEIERTGVDEVFPIPLNLSINGEEIADIEFVGSDLIRDTEEVFTYETTYVLDGWSWADIVREYEVTVTVDPDDEIYMVNAAGDADENNVMSEEIMLSRFYGVPSWLPIILLVASLISFVGSWLNLDKKNLLSLGAGASLGGIFGSLVLLPWDWFIPTIQTIENIIISGMVVGMISFGIFLFAIRFKLKHLLSSVTEHIIHKNGWGEHVEGPPQEEADISPNFYYLTMALTGGLSYFTFLILTSIDYLLLGEVLSLFTSRFFSPLSIPNMIFFVIYLGIGMGVAFTVSKRHEQLWKRILENERTVMEFQERADNATMKGGKGSVPE